MWFSKTPSLSHCLSTPVVKMAHPEEVLTARGLLQQRQKFPKLLMATFILTFTRTPRAA